jgi:hypothetical protein
MPVLAPEGTEARNMPCLVVTSTSTVGLPLESMISLAFIDSKAMLREVVIIAFLAAPRTTFADNNMVVRCKVGVRKMKVLRQLSEGTERVVNEEVRKLEFRLHLLILLLLNLDGHFHLDSGVGVVAYNLEVCVGEPINILDIWVNFDFGEGSWDTLNLLLQSLDVIAVHVRITNGVYELSRLESTDLGHHYGQQRVGGDIKGDTQAHIGRALVHLAAEFPVGHVELAKHVARRQSHFVEICWVPRGHDDSAVGGRVLDLIDAVLQLIYTLTLVVGMHILVGCPKVSPLEAVDRAQVHLLAVMEATAV